MEQWYYAKGGQQGGPVGLEELRSLISNGTLNPAGDLVWNPSMKDWLPAAQVPVLVGAAPAIVGSAQDLEPTRPFAYPAAAGPFAEIPPGTEPIIPTACVKRAFDLTAKHIVPILMITVLHVAISIGISLLLQGFDTIMDWKPVSGSGSGEFTTSTGAKILHNVGTDGRLSFPSSILSTVANVFFMLGVTRIGLNIVSGKAFDVGMLFCGGKWLFRGFLAYFLFWTMFIAGLILLVVPGIIVLIRFGMYQNALVDRNTGVLASLKYSWDLTKGNSLNLFVVFLFSVLTLVAGCAALILGLLFAFPMIWLMFAVAYRWMQYGGRAVIDDPVTGQPLLADLPGRERAKFFPE